MALPGTLSSPPQIKLTNIIGDVSIITLTWNEPELGTHNISHYNIYRSINDGPYNLIGSVQTGIFEDLNLIENFGYSYYVKTVSLVGESNPSNEVFYKVPDVTAPVFNVDPLTPGINDLSGEVNIIVTASDNVAIDRVEIDLGINGQNVQISLIFDLPYEFLFDTKTVEDGTYTLTITVYDTSGNFEFVEFVITISNPIPTTSQTTDTTSVTSSTTPGNTTSDDPTTSSTNTDTQTSDTGDSDTSASLPLPLNIYMVILGIFVVGLITRIKSKHI